MATTDRLQHGNHASRSGQCQSYYISKNSRLPIDSADLLTQTGRCLFAAMSNLAGELGSRVLSLVNFLLHTLGNSPRTVSPHH